MKSLAIPVTLVVLLGLTAWRVYELRAFFGGQEADAAKVASLQDALDGIPMKLADGAYVGHAFVLEDDVLERSGADAYLSRQYRSPDGRDFARLYVGSAQFLKGYFHAPRGCLPAQGFEIVEDVAVPFDAFEVKTDEPVMRRLLVQHGLERMFVHYWFQSDGRVGADMGSTHLFRFLDLLKNQPVRPVHIVTVYTPVYGQDTDGAIEEARRFIEAVSPHIREALEATAP